MIKAWLKAFRLRTLPLAFSVIVAGNALCFFPCGKDFSTTVVPGWHITVEQGGSLHTGVFVLTLLTTLFLQILSNLANDYGDYKKGTDDAGRIGPQRALQSGAITQKQMFSAIVLFTLLSLVAGTGLLFMAFGPGQRLTVLVFLGLGILCIAAAIKYTMGRGAYGYRALGDLAVFVFFGLVGVMGSFYLQIHAWHETSLLVAIAYGFWCTAVLNLNNMRDVDNDVVHRKYTMAYHLGFKGAKVYQLVLVLLPYALVYAAAMQYMGPVKALLILLPLPLSLVQVMGVMKTRERKAFDKFLKVQALTTFLNSVVLFCCLSLLHA